MASKTKFSISFVVHGLSVSLGSIYSYINKFHITIYGDFIVINK